MDKVVDSGSTDTGSIPVRDAKVINASILIDAGVFVFRKSSYINLIENQIFLIVT